MAGLKVWTYWDGPVPPYIGTCLASIRKFCSNFTLLTPENAQEYTDNALNPTWRSLAKPAHRADCVRVATICAHGGLWVDADTVFIRPVSLFEENYKGKFIHTRWTDGRVLNGYFYAEQGNPLMCKWLESINLTLGKHNKKEWTMLGEKIITPLVNSKAFETVEMPLSVFLPINIDRIPNVFFEPIDYRGFITAATVAVGLNHSYFCDHYPQFVRCTVAEFTNSNLIGRVLKDSIDGYRLTAYEEAMHTVLGDRFRGGSIGLGDIRVLVDFVRGKELVVEIGTYCGTTTRLLSTMNQQVVTIDIFERTDLINDPGQRVEYDRLMDDQPHRYTRVCQHLSDRTNVKVVQANSATTAALEGIADRSVDAIFVDGDHSYTGVKSDYVAWFPKVKIGGLFLFHDVNDAHPGVLLLYSELKQDRKVAEVHLAAMEYYTSIKIFQKGDVL